MLRRLRGRLAALLAVLAAAALAAAALVTVADIGLRALARIAGLVSGTPLGWGIVGAVDLVQLFVVSCAAFAIPAAFLARGHVAVDLLHRLLPARGRRVLDRLAALASLLFVGLVLRYGLDQLATVRLMGDRSVTLQIPMEAYWIPFLIGLALSLPAALFDLVDPADDGEEREP